MEWPEAGDDSLGLATSSPNERWIYPHVYPHVYSHVWARVFTHVMDHSFEAGSLAGKKQPTNMDLSQLSDTDIDPDCKYRTLCARVHGDVCRHGV